MSRLSKFSLTPVLGILLFSAIAHADVPRKQPLVKYTGLWSNSPFTSKPPPATTGPAINPLDDFTLTGIAPVPGGYRITIISKKDPELKKIIEPGRTGEFKLVSVNRNPDKALGTTVVLSNGAIQGTVAFEKELLTLKAPPAPQPQKKLTPLQAAQQKAANDNQRQPRPRIVPPPAPAKTTNTKQPSNNNNNTRTDRRGR